MRGSAVQLILRPMWMKPWGCTTWQGWNPSLPAFERKTVKECQNLKPNTAQNIPYAIFKLLDSWASHSWGHSTTGQWNNFYLCGPQKSAMWLLVQLLAGIVPKALSNPGPSDGKVPAWLVVPSGKPQSAPPCSHQEGGGVTVLSSACWNFQRPWSIPRFHGWLCWWGYGLFSFSFCTYC